MCRDSVSPFAGRFRVPAKTPGFLQGTARMLPEFGRDVQFFWSPCMTVLILLHCGRCRAQFSLCSHCYRNHKYCGAPCRETARRDSVRAANKRYRESSEARLDHRDRMRTYRARQTTLTRPVMDHTPPVVGTGTETRPDGNIPGARSGMAALFIVAASQNPTQEDSHAISFPLHSACRICGFECDFLTPAAWIHDGRPRPRRPP